MTSRFLLRSSSTIFFGVFTRKDDRSAVDHHRGTHLGPVPRAARASPSALRARQSGSAEIREVAHGDIVLFHSNAFIQTGGDGMWSHVGVVIVGKSGVPRLFEITGGHVFATVEPLQKMLVEELLQGDRVVAFRRISPAPNEKLLRRYARECMKTRVNYEHVYWRAGFQRLFGSMFPIHCEDEQIGNGSICSSIVVDALRDVGCSLLSTLSPFCPMILVQDTHKRLPLKEGYTWDLSPFSACRLAACRRKKKKNTCGWIRTTVSFSHPGFN